MLQINEHIMTIIEWTYNLVDNIPYAFDYQTWYILEYS